MFLHSDLSLQKVLKIRDYYCHFSKTFFIFARFILNLAINFKNQKLRPSKSFINDSF